MERFLSKVIIKINNFLYFIVCNYCVVSFYWKELYEFKKNSYLKGKMVKNEFVIFQNSKFSIFFKFKNVPFYI